MSEAFTSPEYREKEKRVVLEIGVGSLPHYHSSRLRKPLFEKGDKYIAFDITEDRLKLLSRKPAHFNDLAPDVVRGDALHLPFADESIDEIILPDILNSRIVSETDISVSNDGKITKPSYDSLERKEAYSFGQKLDDLKNGLSAIIKESIRVLKPRGKLTVIQGLSIENALGTSYRPYEQAVRKLMESSEFDGWEEATDYFQPITQMVEAKIITGIKK